MRRKAFPAAPVAFGVVALVAATSAAMALPDDSQADLAATAELPAVPHGLELSSARQSQERRDAAARGDRSDRTPITSSGVDSTEPAEAGERAAWERRRARELADLDQASADGQRGLVLQRAIRWVLPVDDFTLTAGFGDDGSLWSNGHTGQDFAAPTGTPVRSVGAGEITFAGWDGPYGNKIEVRHADGTVTWYNHLSGFARRSGYVGPGDLIGYVGSTGNSTGSHLHLEVRPGGGDPVDPLHWLRDRGLDV